MDISTILAKKTIDIPAVSPVTNPKTSVKKSDVNTLERSPAQDTVTFSAKEKKAEEAPKAKPVKKATNPTKVKKNDFAKTQAKLETVKKEKILTQEVLYFLNPKEDAKGKKSFTAAQTNIINAAYDKVKFFKGFAKELAADADKYGDKILEDYQQIFGGKEGLGQYIVVRKKDEFSVYNKMIKEFKNTRIKTEVHNIFSKKLYGKPYSRLDKDEKGLVALSIADGEVKLDTKDYNSIANAFKSEPKDFLANNIYSKPYKQLNNEQKSSINEMIFNEDSNLALTANNMQARREAINYVRDLVGLRIVLPTGNRAEMAKVEKYIDKAIMDGTMVITRMSNYHANHILPYIKKEKAFAWKQMIPGMELVENSEVRKKNGYTTTQINLEHRVDGRERPILVELQIRTEALNNIGNREHLIYDILENKNISKDIPELKQYYDSTGIVEAVKKVFNNAELEEKYTDYERAYYSYLRNEETGKPLHMKKPLLMEYGLGEYENVLSFEALEIIDEKAKAIKAHYGKKK